MARACLSRRRPLGLSLGLAAALGLGWLAPACFLPSIEAAGLGGGGSGEGGAAGGVGATGGDGGAGAFAPVDCTSVAQCPAQACHEASCDAGSCVYTPTPGVPSPQQTLGDCVETVCDDAGEYHDVVDASDVPMEAPPPCTAWSCATGTLNAAPVTDCDNCCGDGGNLHCLGGQCVGCLDPDDCGPGGQCYGWTCNGQQQCVQAPYPSGSPCGIPMCTEDQQPFVDVETAGACSGTICVTLETPCGDFTCDGNGTACNAACTPADAATTCQLGASCSGGGCADCTTCAEIPLAGYNSNVCPPSLTLRNQVASCFCGGNAPACQTQCANLCNLMFPALTQDCLSCLVANASCQSQAMACQGDIDPI
jgi:hypothetical protein